MLARLLIRDLLLVEKIDLTLARGFMAMTGETGAGKSMILGALRVLFGDALSEQMIRDGAARALVEAEFHLNSPAELRELIGDDYFDPTTTTLCVRRELSRGGRARGFLQDRPATIDLLKEVGERLMDFHGQRDALSLFRPARQLEFLDAFAGVAYLRHDLASAYRRRGELLEARNVLNSDIERRRKEQALLAYQLEEIERLGLREGEEETIATRLRKLEQSEKLASLATQIAGLIEQDEVCAVALVGHARQLADDMKRADEDVAPLAAELAELVSRLRDLAGEVRHYTERVDVNPEELDSLQRRAATLSELRRKHGVDIAEILVQAKRMKETLAELALAEEKLRGVERDLAAADRDLRARALSLSERRHAAAPKFASEITAALKPLGFAKPRFELKLDAPADIQPENIGRTGADQAQFLFSAAPGQSLAPLSEVASGGESSRVTLAIKTVVAGHMKYPLLVYDEIDLGISGRVAAAVASLLYELGRAQQVIVVTHLPQIAARAEHHLLVSKTIQANRTVTTAAMLKPEERAEAIAALLSGAEISGGALAAADDLLNSRNSPSTQAD